MKAANMVIGILVLLPAVAAAQDPVLTLDEVYRMARASNPMVQAAAARAEASVAGISGASLPPDPMVQVGIMNASLPGLRTDMPGAMLPSVQLMQMVPTAGRTGLTGELARQVSAQAAAEAEEVWWEVRARAAKAFHEVHAAERQLETMQETLAWLEQLEEVAATMYAVGQGRQSDVLRAGVEVARMRADIARAEAMRTVARARLNAILGRPADATVPPTAVLEAQVILPDADELRAWADADRPLLEASRIGVMSSRTRETLARRAIWPDLAVGVQYGQRGGEMGTERMGSVMLGFTVPVFASRRQLRLREEAMAMRAMAAAELADARARVDADIVAVTAELERAASLIGLYRAEVLPQAEANVTSAFAAYRVGRVDFMMLVDAQMTVNGYTVELHGLVAEYGWLAAELERAVGRALPRATAASEQEAAS